MAQRRISLTIRNVGGIDGTFWVNLQAAITGIPDPGIGDILTGQNLMGIDADPDTFDFTAQTPDRLGDIGVITLAPGESRTVNFNTPEIIFSGDYDTFAEAGIYDPQIDTLEAPHAREILEDFFTILDLDPEGIEGWFRLDNPENLTLEAGNIRFWRSHEPSDYGIFQGDAGLQPELVEGIIGGRPVARFDRDFMQRTPLIRPFTRPIGVFFVLRITGETDWDFQNLYNSATERGQEIRWDSRFGSSGQILMTDGFGNTLSYDKAIPFDFIITTCYFTTDSNSQLRENGQVMASGFTGTNAIDSLRIGKRFTREAFLAGDIAEFIIVGRPLDELDLSVYERYLSAKFNIPLAVILG
jgi:hypothetical protein